MSAHEPNTEEAKNASIDELLKELSSSREGISSHEAEERLKQYGYNEISEKKVNPIIKFLRYFWGPIPWMIEIAAILSALVYHWEDFAIIFALLLVNSTVGFWEEHKAENAIELLKKRLALRARVLRDGRWELIPARELVPGDIIRVLVFISSAIIIFNFYPLTAMMIVILSLLNDIPIMTIAYDNTKPLGRPARWEMRKVLIIATMLGIVGVISSFLLFYVGQNILRLDRLTIQTLMFLKLAVAGHMTIYLTRSHDRHFWSRPYPAGILFWTTEITQFFGTLVAVYGIFMKPIGWGLAGFIWGWAVAALLITDSIKIRFYRRFERREKISV